MANKITDAATKLYDGFKNVVTGLATQADSHAMGATWFLRPISQHEIEAAYRGSWLTKKIVDVPATDMIAPWRRWLGTPEQITAIEKEERRIGLKKKIRKAVKFARMYGGSAIIIGVSGDDPSEPLELDRVKVGGLSYIHVITRHELTISGIDMDPGSPRYGEPLFYMVNGGARVATVHPTRVARFVFGELPDQLAFQEQTWGDSILLSVRDAVLNADTAQGAFAAMTTKAQTSTLKIPGLTNIVSSSEGEQQLIERTRVAQAFKSMFNLNIISAPARAGDTGEEWQENSFSFAGMPEMGGWLVNMAAAAANMPVTKLTGQSASGLSATGEGDEKNYIQMLSSGREFEVTPGVDIIDEVLIRSATGARDEKISYSWEPFQSESENEKATNAKVRAETFKVWSEAGSVPSEVLAKITKAQIIDSEDYPGAEDAYHEYEAAGGTLEEITPPATPANDNPVMGAAINGLVAQGKVASVAARDAAIMLADAEPMTLCVSRAVTNFVAIRAWFEDQGVTVTVPDDKAHVTLAYSRQPVDWLKVGADDWDSSSPGFTIQSGGPRMMEVFNGTLVQVFGSSQLSYRHEAILRAGASWDHADFSPHFSLNYEFGSSSIDDIKPWLGPIELGFERFEKLDENWKASDD